MRAVVVVVVGAICIAAPGCTVSTPTAGPPVVSKADLQEDITARLIAAGQPPKSVTCADDLIGEVSRTTRCEVVLSDDTALEPIVTATSVDGTTVNYEMTPALSREQLQSQVASRMAQKKVPVDSVSCGEGLDGITGDEAHCTVKGDGEVTDTVVEVTGVDGLLMNFRINPQ